MTPSTKAKSYDNLIKSEKMVFNNNVWEEKLLLQTWNNVFTVV